MGIERQLAITVSDTVFVSAYSDCFLFFYLLKRSNLWFQEAVGTPVKTKITYNGFKIYSHNSGLHKRNSSFPELDLPTSPSFYLWLGEKIRSKAWACKN